MYRLATIHTASQTDRRTERQHRDVNSRSLHHWFILIIIIISMHDEIIVLRAQWSSGPR